MSPVQIVWFAQFTSPIRGVMHRVALCRLGDTTGSVPEPVRGFSPVRSCASARKTRREEMFFPSEGARNARRLPTVRHRPGPAVATYRTRPGGDPSRDYAAALMCVRCRVRHGDGNVGLVGYRVRYRLEISFLAPLRSDCLSTLGVLGRLLSELFGLFGQYRR